MTFRRRRDNLGPAGQYYLVQEAGQLVLLELDASGSGAKFRNHWQEEDGDHFFSYVKGRQGWHFMVPRERTREGWRLVLVQYSVDESSGVMKPVGNPAFACPMVPSLGEAHTAPRPPTTSPTLTTPPPPAPPARVPPVVAPPPSAGAPTGAAQSPPAPRPAPPPPVVPSGFARAHEPLKSGRYLEAARTFREVLSSRGAQGYSIQVATHCDAGRVTDQLQESGVPPELFILRLTVEKRPCWGLYWGVFRSTVDAQAGQERMPPALRQPGQTPVAISRILAQS